MSLCILQCKKIEGESQIVEEGEVSEEDESLDPDWRKLNRKVMHLFSL